MTAAAIERTKLWGETLRVRRRDPNASARETLRTALLALRDRAALLAAEIARDLPNYTVHDVTHLDAVWEMADLIAGSGYDLNPAEAFVLGGAILVHDLGMGIAAYPGGIASIRTEVVWRDAVAGALRNILGRTPTPAEIANPPDPAVRVATAEALRLLHARQADRLAHVSWTDSVSGTHFHLIDSPELRTSFGTYIGRIAASHWWSLDAVRRDLEVVFNPPTFCPVEWTVDVLMLACLLRVADAAQLDERRAPPLLAVVRQPAGESSVHWRFQSKLQRPREKDQRLVYTSGDPFGLEEADAWWQCLDALRGADRELRTVDALLADAGKPRFRARSVAGVDDPARLREHVPTRGWVPVDARINVSDVPALVQRIGGEELYGRDATVPLRELIQNATDAVRARRLYEQRPPGWGTVLVRLGKEGEEHFVEVADTGIGMSHDVLAGPLLDFGSSYWNSDLMRRDWPGLAAKGFSATGKFGIGFFSVFMWGSRVTVTTRRPDEARNATRVLEFSTGVARRPVIRPAREDEMLLEGGTLVKVWLQVDPYSEKGLLFRRYNDFWTLWRLCGYLAPCIDVDLDVEERGARTRVVTARDWITLKPDDLLRRVMQPASDYDELRVRPLIPRAAPLLQNIRDENGETVARACVLPGHNNLQGANAAVVVGGLRGGELIGCAGVFVGDVVTASRGYAIPSAHESRLAEWAVRQEEALAERESQVDQEQSAVVCAALGAPCEHLPIAYGRSGWMRPSDIEQEFADFPEVLLVDTDALSYVTRGGITVELLPNVLVVSLGYYSLLRNAPAAEVWPSALDASGGPLRRMQDLVIAALARGWGATFEEVSEASEFSGWERDFNRQIGSLGGQSIVESVDVIRNPSRSNSTPE